MINNIFAYLKKSNEKLFLIFFVVFLCQITFVNTSFSQVESKQATSNPEINNPYADTRVYDRQNPNKKQMEEQLKGSGNSTYKSNIVNENNKFINNADKITEDDLKNAHMKMVYGYPVPIQDGHVLSPEELKMRKDITEAYGVATGKAYGLSEETMRDAKEPSCKSPKDLKAEYLTNNCIFCPFFSIVFNAVSRIAKHSFNKIAPSALGLLGLAMALWLARAIILFIATIDKRDPKDLIQGILVQSFKVLIAVILLKSTSSYVFSLILEPLFLTGLKIPGIVFGSSCNDVISNDSINGFAIATEGGLPREMGLYVNCVIRQVEQQLVDTMTIGATIS